MIVHCSFPQLICDYLVLLDVVFPGQSHGYRKRHVCEILFSASVGPDRHTWAALSRAVIFGILNLFHSRKYFAVSCWTSVFYWYVDYIFITVWYAAFFPQSGTVYTACLSMRDYVVKNCCLGVKSVYYWYTAFWLCLALVEEQHWWTSQGLWVSFKMNEPKFLCL
jgi:hypothetical protein